MHGRIAWAGWLAGTELEKVSANSWINLSQWLFL